MDPTLDATARPARSKAFDGAVAAGSALLSLLLLMSFVRGMTSLQVGACIVLLLVHHGALFWRRTRPRASFGLNLISAVVFAALGLPTVILHVAPLVALYSLSTRVPLPAAATGLGLSTAGMVVASAVRGFPEDVSTMLGNSIAIAGAWVLGTLIHKRQDYVESLEARTRELEEAREALAERAVAEERMRIARELHDVVAHSLSMIAVQSGMGAHVIEQRPDEARRALVAIRAASSEALDEMRRVVGVLRGSDDPELAPVAGVDDLPRLVSQVGGAGPRVELAIRGEPRPLAPGLSVTLYRIAQESLTNVVRHAHASKVRVTLAYQAGEIALEVVDDGRALGSADGEGHGLQGMRERAEMFGGRVEAGPLRDGGFRVLATFPQRMGDA